VKQSKLLTITTGWSVIAYIAFTCLLMTAPAELHASGGNPFINSSEGNSADPTGIHVDAPTLDSGSLPTVERIFLPPEPKGSSVKSESIATHSVKGILHRVAAIGGETTGWAVRLEHPFHWSEKTSVRNIEIEADSGRLEPLQGKQVEAHGRIIWRQGIERGRYHVMMFESIHEFH